MLSGSAQALAFDHPLELQDNLRARSRICPQRFGKIEVTGDLQGGELASLRRGGILFPEECCDLVPESVHAPNSLPVVEPLWEQRDERGQIRLGILAICK